MNQDRWLRPGTLVKVICVDDRSYVDRDLHPESEDVGLIGMVASQEAVISFDPESPLYTGFSRVAVGEAECQHLVEQGYADVGTRGYPLLQLFYTVFLFNGPSRNFVAEEIEPLEVPGYVIRDALAEKGLV